LETVRWKLTRPDICKLVSFEEVNTSTITTNVEVLLEVAALLESDLSQVTTAIITEENHTTGLEDIPNVLHSLCPLSRGQSREDEDHDNHVDTASFQTRRQGIFTSSCGIPDVCLQGGLVLVCFLCANNLNSLLGIIASVDLQERVLVQVENWVCRVSCTCTNFKHCRSTVIFFGNFSQDWELLGQPFAILEEVCIVVAVKLVPPLLGVLVEALLVKVGDRSGSLELLLALDEFLVCVVGLDVVPCIVSKDVVAFFQVTCAKLERVGWIEAGTPYAASSSTSAAESVWRVEGVSGTVTHSRMLSVLDFGHGFWLSSGNQGINESGSVSPSAHDVEIGKSSKYSEHEGSGRKPPP
ncbi:methyltransferase, partial [Aureobasidium melanogenum]